MVEVTTANDFETLFGPDAASTPEDIFSFNFIRLTNEGNRFVVFFHLPACAWAAGGLGPLYGLPASPVIRNWNANDLRKKFTLYSEYPNKSGVIIKNAAAQPLRFGKFKDRQAASTAAHGNDLPVFRYADALLIYAEAASQANGAPTALALERLNMVMRRGYGVPSTTPNAILDIKLPGLTATSFRDLVLNERSYEFMSEAKRWFDLKRLGRVKEIIKIARGIDVADKHLLWPLPVTEIDNNPDIEPTDQNPGY